MRGNKVTTGMVEWTLTPTVPARTLTSSSRSLLTIPPTTNSIVRLLSWWWGTKQWRWDVIHNSWAIISISARYPTTSITIRPRWPTIPTTSISVRPRWPTIPTTSISIRPRWEVAVRMEMRVWDVTLDLAFSLEMWYHFRRIRIAFRIFQFSNFAANVSKFSAIYFYGLRWAMPFLLQRDSTTNQREGYVLLGEDFLHCLTLSGGFCLMSYILSKNWLCYCPITLLKLVLLSF